MDTCAVVDSTSTVINIIVASVTDLPPDGCQLVITPDANGNNAQIGGTWNGTNFLPASN